MKIAVVGTGYVGLVTGTCFAETGNNVICVDIDEKKVERMKNGEVPIYEPGLKPIFDRSIREERLSFTTDLKAAIKDALVICTEWSEFRVTDLEHFHNYMNKPVIFDGRNLYDLDKAREAKITYISVGRPEVHV